LKGITKLGILGIILALGFSLSYFSSPVIAPYQSSNNFWTPDSNISVTGTHVAGDITNLSDIDQSYWNFTEEVGTPGLSELVNYNNNYPYNLPGNVTTVISYNGGSGHTICYECYNHTGSAFVTIFDYADGFVDVLNTTMYDFTEDFKNTTSGEINCRFDHPSPGNVNHDFDADFAGIQPNCSLGANYTQINNVECSSLDTNEFTWDTNGFDLNVTGDVDITGILDGNNGEMTFGSLTINSGGTYDATSSTTTITSESSIGKAWDTDIGTYNHNNGLVIISSGTVTNIENSNSKPFYDLTITGNSQVYIQTTASVTHVANDLIVADQLTHSSGAGRINVLGDVTVNSGGNLNNLARSGLHSFGSLVINLGGTYTATSGVTNLTSESVLPGGSGTGAFYNNGTLTHSDGTFEISIVGSNTILYKSSTSSGDFYDINITSTNEVYPKYNFVVDNDLIISSVSTLYPTSTTFTIDVTGDVDVSGILGDGISTADYSFGSLTIKSGGKYNSTTGTTNITNYLFSHGTLIDNSVTIISPIVLVGNETTMGSNWNNITELFVGNMLNTSNNQLGVGNLTIVSGGILDSGTSIITVNDSWKSSGGFIGKNNLDIDGVSQHTNVSTGINLGKSNTINFWYYYPGISSTEYFLGGITDGSLGFRFNNVSMLLYIGSTGDSSTITTTLTDNTWNMLTLVRTSTTTVDFYINSKLQGEFSNVDWSTDDTDILYIGRREAGLYAEAKFGRIDFYNTTLSASNIFTNMFKECSELSNQANLVTCYQFDNGNGTSITDFKGNNDGIASVDTVWSKSGTYLGDSSTVNMTGSNFTMYHYNGTMNTVGNMQPFLLDINGTAILNINESQVVSFSDSLGSGFGTSSGTLNVFGNETDYVTFQSNNETTPNNLWTIDESTFSSITPLLYANLSSGNNTGDFIIVVGANDTSGGKQGVFGNWSFDTPVVILNSPTNNSVLPLGILSTQLNYDVLHSYWIFQFQHNVTDPNGLDINNNFTETLSPTTLESLIDTIDLSSQVEGTYTLTVNASTNHNKPETKKALETVRSMDMSFHDYLTEDIKKINKEDKFNNGNTNQLNITKDGKVVLTIEISDSQDSKFRLANFQTEMEYTDFENFKFSWKMVMKGSKAKVRLISDNLLHIEDDKYAGWFVYGDEHECYIDFQDIIDTMEGVELKVSEIEKEIGEDKEYNEGYIIKLSNKDWKSGDIIEFDPSLGGVNQIDSTYFFDYVSSTLSGNPDSESGGDPYCPQNTTVDPSSNKAKCTWIPTDCIWNCKSKLLTVLPDIDEDQRGVDISGISILDPEQLRRKAEEFLDESFNNLNSTAVDLGSKVLPDSPYAGFIVLISLFITVIVSIIAIKSNRDKKNNRNR